jgi:hypothetical protein
MGGSGKRRLDDAKDDATEAAECADYHGVYDCAEEHCDVATAMMVKTYVVNACFESVFSGEVNESCFGECGITFGEGMPFEDCADWEEIISCVSGRCHQMTYELFHGYFANLGFTTCMCDEGLSAMECAARVDGNGDDPSDGSSDGDSSDGGKRSLRDFFDGKHRLLEDRADSEVVVAPGPTPVDEGESEAPSIDGGVVSIEVGGGEVSSDGYSSDGYSSGSEDGSSLSMTKPVGNWTSFTVPNLKPLTKYNIFFYSEDTSSPPDVSGDNQEFVYFTEGNGPSHFPNQEMADWYVRSLRKLGWCYPLP